MRERHTIDASVAQSIRKRRTKLGWSQNDLALRIGESESTISKAESLRLWIPPERRAAIERALAEAEVAGGGDRVQ